MPMDWTDYFTGGIASVLAVIFTNPFEVIKTRMQLQGELAKKGTYATPYSSVMRAFIAVARNDGVLGLQKGLVPSMYFQFIMNFIRLGLYSNVEHLGWLSDETGKVSFTKSLVCGSVGGIIGCFAGSPFFLVKTHVQSQSAPKVAVGYQHNYRGMMDGFRQIYASGGVKALYHGALACVPRAGLGSGSQLAAFGTTKDFLRRHDLITNETLISFVGGTIAGTVMTVVITPPDVVATRFYNQQTDHIGHGMQYRNFSDCVVQIWKIEGIGGFYKGFWPNYLRMGQHSALVLFFFDEMTAVRKKYFSVDS